MCVCVYVFVQAFPISLNSFVDHHSLKSCYLTEEFHLSGFQ